MEAILIPIFICVVLPVSIVLIVFLARMNEDNRRAQILTKAIEANNNLDTTKLIEALQSPQKSACEIRNKRLLNGCIYSLLGLVVMIYAFFLPKEVSTFFLMGGGAVMAIGISFLIVYYVTRPKTGSKQE